MPMNFTTDLENYAKIVNLIEPEVVQLNTPKRPYPMTWHRENRGNHLGIHHHTIKKLKTITPELATEIEDSLRNLINAKLISIYNHT